MDAVIGYSYHLERHPEIASQFEYTWLEGPNQSKLAYLKECPDWNNTDVWHEGRNFGPLGEYRWKKNSDGLIHSVLILDQKELPSEFVENRFEITPQADGTRELLLWGDWIDPEGDPTGNPTGGPLFYAPEIPLVQHYPIPLEKLPPKGKNVWLVIQGYHHTSKGDFVRCVTLKMKEIVDEQGVGS